MHMRALSDSRKKPSPRICVGKWAFLDLSCLTGLQCTRRMADSDVQRASTFPVKLRVHARTYSGQDALQAGLDQEQPGMIKKAASPHDVRNSALAVLLTEVPVVGEVGVLADSVIKTLDPWHFQSRPAPGSETSHFPDPSPRIGRWWRMQPSMSSQPSSV